MKKNSKKFLMFMDNQRKYPLLNMQSNIYLAKWRVPHNFLWTSTSWIIYLASAFTRNPGEEMILFHIEEGKRERRHNRHSPSKTFVKLLLSSTMLCVSMLCEWNTSSSCLSWYLYDAKSKGYDFSQTTPSLEQYSKSKKLQTTNHTHTRNLMRSNLFVVFLLRTCLPKENPHKF
jgi:hypothetical protein